VRLNANEKWRNLDALLRDGGRGLPGGDSLPKLLERERGVRNIGTLPDLVVEQVAAWARAHRERTGRLPHCKLTDGIPEAPGETWACVERALRDGRRGFPGGDTLARFVSRHLGVRNNASAPRLSVEQILDWADRHHRRTGRWPGMESGPVHGVASETWAVVEVSLRNGLRGLPGGDTLYQLLRRERGVRRAGRDGSLGAHRPGSEA
jgi:hypothetical protein